VKDGRLALTDVIFDTQNLQPLLWNNKPLLILKEVLIMTREDFINYLVENNIPYCEDTENGNDYVYVFDKTAYELKKKYYEGRKLESKDIYIPYLRVSHFVDRGLLMTTLWYVRDNGICEWTPENVVMDRVKSLGYV
jgi:hypothetical protein